MLAIETTVTETFPFKKAIKSNGANCPRPYAGGVLLDDSEKWGAVKNRGTRLGPGTPERQPPRHHPNTGRLNPGEQLSGNKDKQKTRTRTE